MDGHKPNSNTSGKGFISLRNSLKEWDIDTVRVLNKAWDYINTNCSGDITEIGDSIPDHSLAVARITADELGLGLHSVNAALLHELSGDRFEDLSKATDTYTIDAFNIIEGLRKIKAVRTERTKFQSENFIKLLLTVSDDIRSTLIQLADRLHHLRHFKNISNDRRALLAQECAYLYAPIAHRLGLYKTKTELEDLAMQVLEPEAYSNVARMISESSSKQKVYIEDFVRPIEKSLHQNKLKYDIKWRTKSISSIWGKMKKQGVDFDQVYDVFAVRIIIDDLIETEKASCWKVYSLVTDIYSPSPERLRDWISTPKASGYESLHTTVLGPGKRWVEVQVRSRRMDDIAEKGHAAHWQYKDSKADQSSASWLKSIRDLLEKPQSDAFRDAHDAKADFYSDKIFVFTPNGDLRKLPQNATVLDFAFDIHTKVGSECMGAKVNNKNVTIKHILKNGDLVEIQTSKNQSPKSDWLGFVTTTKAKTRIKRALKEAIHKEASQGREILERKLKNWKLPFNDENLAILIKKFKFRDSVDLYAAVAKERIDLKELRDFLRDPEKPSNGDKSIAAPMAPLSRNEPPAKPISGDILEIDKNLNSINFSLAKCCNPIFGDDIFGFVTVSKGITIHRVSCPNATELSERYPYRLIKAKWKQAQESSSYIASIKLVGTDKLGIVNSISEVISHDMKVNMRSLSFDTIDGRFEGSVTVNVFDTQHLEALLRKLQKIDGITRAIRLS